MKESEVYCPECGHKMRQLQMPLSSPWHCDNCEEVEKSIKELDVDTEPGQGVRKYPTPMGACEHKCTYEADFPGWGVGRCCKDCGEVLEWLGDPMSDVSILSVTAYTRDGEIEAVVAQGDRGTGFYVYQMGTWREI